MDTENSRSDSAKLSIHIDDGGNGTAGASDSVSDLEDHNEAASERTDSTQDARPIIDEQHSFTKENKKKEKGLSVAWRLSDEDVLDFLPLTHPTASFIVPTGSSAVLRKISSTGTKGGVGFTPSVQVIKDDGDLDNGMAAKVSCEIVRKCRLTAFNAQFEDFKKVEAAKAMVRRALGNLSSLLCALSVVIGCFCVADLEMSYKCGTAFNFRGNLNTNCSISAKISPVVFKSLISTCSMCMCCILFVHYGYQCRNLIILHQLPIDATVLNSPLRSSFLAELFICFLHVPPYLDRFVPTELQVVVFLRFYLTSRYMKEHNERMRSRSTRFLASVLQIELTSGYLIKTFFLKHPLVMITACYVLNLFGCGYMVFILDRYHDPHRHNSFEDSLWMQAVTMTTLGYGDVTPDSLLGRTVVAFSAVCGIFLMALLISVIHEGLQLTQQEKRIMAYVERIEYSKLYKNLAARCIQATWRLHRWHKHGKASLTELQCRLHRMGLFQPSGLLIRRLYNALYHWRNVKKSRTPDDQWTKDFVADNTAIMLTDVLRKMETIEEYIGVASPSNETDSDKDQDDQNTTVHYSETDNDHHIVPTAWAPSTADRKTGTGTVAETSARHASKIIVKEAEAGSSLLGYSPPPPPSASSSPSPPPRKHEVMARLANAEEKLDSVYRILKAEFTDLRAIIQRTNSDSIENG